ncbi:MAG: GNAT family N-acetyltransferase [Rickettsiales bacterium]
MTTSPSSLSNLTCKNDAVEIRDYVDSDRDAFERFNRAWLEKYFSVEPIDAGMFADPRKTILDKGGKIFVACIDNIPVGVCALKTKDENAYELSKMGVDSAQKGKGIAKLLTQQAISVARAEKKNQIIIYSNRILENALRIYRDCGFVEIPLTDEDKKLYARGDIKLELVL